MIESISLFPVFGLPLIVYLGMATLSLLLFTASISVMTRRGMRRIPFRWHPRMAAVTIAVAIVHGFLGIMLFL
jgi:MFS superfamily sulfate permease-like transporter